MRGTDFGNPGNRACRWGGHAAILIVLSGVLMLGPAGYATARSDSKPAQSQTLSEKDFNEEVDLGKKAADEVANDKNTKVLSDPELVSRVERIGNAIADIAKTKFVPATYGSPLLAKFNYSFKVIDDKTVNAFSLPGGYVYVNKGLLDYVQSDDELAGVIAHEVAHAAHHHAMKLMKAQNKQMLAVAAAVLAGAAAGAKGGDLGNLAYIANLITMAKTSEYGIEAEYDADRSAVQYMASSTYNPVGMLTFMERLARDEARNMQVDLGVMATHPYSYKRAAAIVQTMTDMNMPINRRLATTYTRVQVKPVPNTDVYSVWISDKEVIKLANTESEKSEARAERVSDDLSTLLLAGAAMKDVKLGGGGKYVVVMNKVLISPKPQDAELAGNSVSQVAESAVKAIQGALWNEVIQQRY